MRTYINDSDFAYLNSEMNGLLAYYETRNSELFKSDSSSKMAFRILCERLTTDTTNPEKSRRLLHEVLDCIPNRTPCNHICCPVCRTKRQQAAVKRTKLLFQNATNENSFFLTALMPMTPYLSEANSSIIRLRKSLRNNFRAYQNENAKHSFNVYGAFEYDLKTRNEYRVSSDRAKQLFQELGYDANTSESMWLPHLHAIISPLDDSQRKLIKDIVQYSIFSDKHIKYSIELKSFRSDKDVSENLSELSKYMWKVRLQHSDNIFATKEGTSKAKYKSMFPSEAVSSLSSYVKSKGSFKSLKFEVKGNQ